MTKKNPNPKLPKDIDEGEPLADDLAPGETKDNSEAPAMDDVPENADELVGDEVESDFDPEKEEG